MLVQYFTAVSPDGYLCPCLISLSGRNQDDITGRWQSQVTGEVLVKFDAS